MNERYKILESNVSPGVVIYDNIMDKVIIDICTGNNQMDRIIAETCFKLIHDKQFYDAIMDMI